MLTVDPEMIESVQALNEDGLEAGQTLMSTEEQEYANEISQALSGPDAAPILSEEAWKDFNKLQTGELLEEEYQGMTVTDAINITSGLFNANDVNNRAAAYATLRAGFDTDYMTSAAAISRARQMGAEALIDNPALFDTDKRMLEKADFYASKDAVLENHIRMAETNVDSAPWYTHAWGVFKNLFGYVPGVISEYTQEEALQAITGKDEEWLDRSDNMELFFNIISAAHQDPRLGPVEFDKFLDIIDSKMKESGVNPVQARELYQYLQNHDRGTQTTGMILDGTLLVAGAAKGVVGGAKGAVLAAKAAGGKASTKALAGVVGGVKGAVIETAHSIPLVGGVVGKTVTGSTEFLLKGASNRFSRLGRLIAAGNKRRAIKQLEETLKAIPDAGASLDDLRDIYDHSTMNVAKPVKHNADDVLAAEKEIQSTKGYLATVRAWTNEFLSNFHLKDIMAESWEPTAVRIADSLMDTGYIEDIIPAQATFKDIMDIVQPIAQKDGNILARIKLDMVPDVDEKLVSQATEKTFKSETGQLSFTFAEDPAEEYAKTVAATITKHANKTLGNENVKIVPYLDGSTWKLQAEVRTNKGWAQLYSDLRGLSKEQNKHRSFLSSLFTVTSKPTSLNELDALRHMSASQLQSTKETIMDAFKGLSGEDKDLMEALIQTSIHYNAFYKPETLLARGLSPKLVDTYSKWRAFNDLDYFVRNTVTRDYMNSLGLKSLSFNGAYIGYGRIIPVIEESEYRAKILGSAGQAGRKYIAIDSNKAEDIIAVQDIPAIDLQIKAWHSQGYRIVESLHSPDEFHKASQILHLYKGSGLVEDELPEFVTSYVAGGRRFFDRDGGFVKQIQLAKNANNRLVITGVRTFGADRDIKGLVERVAVIEKIRRAYALGAYSEVNHLINKSGLPKGYFHDAQSFADWAKGFGMDIENLDNALEVVKDGVTLSSYDKLTKLGAFDTVGPDDMYNIVHRSAFQALTNEAKLAKLRRTGRELFTWDLSKAVPVDFEHQMRYLVNDMIHNGVMKYYTQFYASDFAKNFASVIQDANIMSAEQMLLTGTVKKGLIGDAKKLADAAQTAQANFAAIRGIPSEFDQKIAGFFNNVLDSVFGWTDQKLKGTFKGKPEWAETYEKIAHGVRVNWEKLKDKDVLGFARAITAHNHLGMFNLSQLYKQWVSDYAVWLLEPQASAKACRYHLPFTTALFASDGKVFKAVEKLAKNFGDAPKAVKQDFENLIRMGAFTHGTAGGFAEAGMTVGNWFKKASFLPFNFGEMANRVKAYLTALHAKGYHGKILSTKELAEVTNYAQTLFMHMDATGLSRVQTGTFGKTFLQYLGYRLRWFETICFDNNLTKAQKWRLGLGNALLVGAKGMAGVKTYNWLTNVFADDMAKPIEEDDALDEVQNILANGLLNWASSESGLDINLGAVLDLSYGDLVEGLFFDGKWEIPSLTFTGKALQGLGDAAHEVNKMFYDDYTSQDFTNFLQIMSRSGTIPPSISKPYLGYIAWKTGMEYNSRGQLTSDDNTRLRSVLKMLGFSDLKQAMVYEARLQEQSFNKRVSDFKKELQPIWNEYFRNPTARGEAEIQMLIRTAPFDQATKGRIVNDLYQAGPRDQTVTLFKQVVQKQLERNGIGGSDVAVKYIEELKQEGEE